MNIFFKIPQNLLAGVDLQSIRESLEENIEYVTKEYFPTNAFIDTVIFADENSYGSAIESIDENETYTNRENAIGYGKCMFREGKNYIVYRADILYGDSLASPASYYIFCHEIGHAIDNSLRNLNIMKAPTYFNIDNVSMYYIDIIISEFFASYNGIRNKTFEREFINYFFVECQNGLIVDCQISIDKLHFDTFNIENYTINQRKYGVADAIGRKFVAFVQALAILIKENCLDYMPFFSIEEEVKKNILSVFGEIIQEYPKITSFSKEKLCNLFIDSFYKECKI